jgi:iron complex outermembrane receptor protein
MLILAAPALLEAQEGAVAGTIRGAESGAPLESADVRLVGPDGAEVGRTASGPSGGFRVSGVAPGSYTLVVSLAGWQTLERAGVQVRAGETTSVSLAMVPRAFELNPITVSAGRQEEKLLDAPATISVVNEEEVQAQPANSFMDHVEGLPGVDVIQTGLQQGYVVARGFNDIFSGSMLTLTDYRIARVPSLRANIPHLIPTTDLDVERMEVVLGPGSALYGPNAANGVLHILTKSPIDHPGASFNISGGLREQSAFGAGPLAGPGSEDGTFRVEGRLAGKLSEEFGVKVSGLYFTGEDWRFQDPEEFQNRQLADACLAQFDPLNPACQIFAPAPGELPEADRLNRIGERDFGLERYAVDVRSDWRPDDNTSVVLSGGVNQAVNSVDMTGIGTGQVQDFTTFYTQLRANRGEFFGQVFFNQNRAGDTFILRTGNPIDDESWLLVGQLQHAADLGDKQRFVYGADVLRTNARTNRTINGVHEDEDAFWEVGGYVQSETALSDRWDLNLALRTDWHSILDEAIVSPRAGLVFKPDENNNIRFTFNRAFSTPDNNNFFLDITAQRIPLSGPFSYGLQAFGTLDGIQFQRDAGGRPMMKSPFTPAALGGAGQFLPTRTPVLWDLAVGVVAAQDPAAGQLLGQLPAPTEEQVGVLLGILNPGDQSFAPFPGQFAALEDIPQLEEETTNTFELGWKGILGDRLLVTADAYYSRIEDFIGPLRIETPNAFLDGEEVAAYLAGAGVPAPQAQALAEAMAGVPLGVVTPQMLEDGSRPASLVLTYRNFGTVDLFGADLGIEYRLTDRWNVGLAGSWVSDETFETEGLPVSLNAAEAKARASLGYRDSASGFRGEASYRFVDAFPASSGVFEGAVDSYHVVDLTLGFEVPGTDAVTFQLDVQNLTDNAYSTFPGAPELGRYTVGRLQLRL